MKIIWKKKYGGKWRASPEITWVNWYQSPFEQIGCWFILDSCENTDSVPPVERERWGNGGNALPPCEGNFQDMKSEMKWNQKEVTMNIVSIEYSLKSHYYLYECNVDDM